jgi:uncharacterized protein (DUF2141 family)
MRFAALLLIGMATAAMAEAQTSPARFGLLPMPNTLPTVLFAPDPLAGTLLRPLTMPSADSTAFAEVAPEPAVLPMAAATLLPEDPPPQAAPDLVLEPTPDATTAPDATGDTTVAPVPDAPPVVETPPPVAAPPATTVTVIVENVETDSGNVNVAICDKGLSREGCPYHHEVKAQQGFVETQFADIPPGSYAIVGYHDVNGNDQFDKMMGIPREPYALSGNAAEMLVPTFADAELPIKSGENAVIIRLKRLGG